MVRNYSYEYFCYYYPLIIIKSFKIEVNFKVIDDIIKLLNCLNSYTVDIDMKDYLRILSKTITVIHTN